MEVGQKEQSQSLPSLDEVMERPFVRRANCAVAGLLAGEIIKHDDSSSMKVKIEQERVIPFLESVQDKFDKECSPERHNLSEDQVDVIDIRVRELFDPVTIQFMKDGIVPDTLYKAVREKLFTPKSITTNTSEDVGYSYGTYNFSEWIAEYSIGTKAVLRYSNEVMDAAKAAGVDLDPNTIRDIALTIMTGHEYGHAAENGLFILENDKHLEASGVQRTLNTEFDSGRKIERELRKKLGEEIAPDLRLKQLFPNEDDMIGSGKERVATGFELHALGNALTSAGIPSGKVAEIVANYKRNNMEQGVLEFQHIKSLGDTAGLSVEDINKALTSINGFVIDEKKGDLLGTLPRYDFTGMQLGYYLPLTPNHLAKYFRLSSSPNLSIA